jgi:hypothetical protein
MNKKALKLEIIDPYFWSSLGISLNSSLYSSIKGSLWLSIGLSLNSSLLSSLKLSLESSLKEKKGQP